MRSPILTLITASLFLVSISTTQADLTPEALCTKNVQIGDYHFDISSLKEKDSKVEHTIPKIPAEETQEFTFNLCQKITQPTDWPEYSKCKDNTHFCERILIKKHPVVSDPIIIEVYGAGNYENDPLQLSAVPVADPNDSTKSSKLEVTLKSSSYSAKVILECTDTDSEPSYMSHTIDGTRSVIINWKNRAACGQKQDIVTPPDEDNDNKPSGGGTSSWKILFILLFVSFGAYLGLGVLYNWRTYNARGWDLLPHSDFWRDLPFLIKDLIRSIYYQIGARRHGGGYMSV